MNIGIVYAKAARQTWINIEVPDDATVMQAIELSGFLQQFPEIDLEEQKVGIHGRVTRLDAQLRDGDRVEIYRAIIADPETVERRDQ
ncbi:MAG: RnfH family protein [Alphaproteobacteria bacterium]|nr:RnfH family protein [Alphaproteobacteria bacterium]MBF0249371.1 RnfH family protein [Alphaproteobacteria bacterium]